MVEDLIDYCQLLLKEFVPSKEAEQIAPKISGIWIASGNSYANRWVFRKSGTVEKYYDDELYKTYYWNIRTPSDPSKSNLRELTLTNIKNPGNEIGFYISVLTGEQLILVYGTGVDESERVFDRY